MALDRLDGRRHTFGLLLTHLIEHLNARLGDLHLLRRRPRADLVQADANELILPSWLENHYAYSTFIPLYLKKSGVDLVHYPFLYSPYFWWGTGIKRVVTIHGVARVALSGDLVDQLGSLQRARYIPALSQCDAIITVSEASKRDIIEHYRVPPEKVHVVYNGVGEEFKPQSDCQQTLKKYRVTRPYILSVSTIKPKKNVVGTVRAFARLKRHGWPHKLVLVGYTKKGYTAVSDAIRELGLAGEVIQTGFVDSRELPSFYAGADLLVFPSFHEGFGLPVIEAFASGCPVVTSAVGSLPEVAGEAAVYCAPDDEADISEKMHQVLSNDQLRKGLIERGLERAKQFSWGRCADRTIEVYEKVLRG
jgi:glycosyltransferase involved in cell wall biosynthesis